MPPPNLQEVLPKGARNPKTRIGKGNGSNFTARKPGRHYINLVMKVNITNNVTWVSCTPKYDV